MKKTIQLLRIAIAWLLSATDADVVTTVKAGLTGIAANPDTFVTPNPPLATVQTKLDAFVGSLANAATGGPVQTAIKNSVRADLAVSVRTLINYANDTCQGDVAKLRSSGFPLQKATRDPVGIPTVPFAPVLAQGDNTGVLNAVSSPVNGAAIYNWELALAATPDTVVQTAQTTAARTTFEGLTAGQTYVARLSAVGSAGESDWSDYGSYMVI